MCQVLALSRSSENVDINGHLEGSHVFYYMNQGKTTMRDMESRIHFSKNVYLFRVKILLSLGIRH